MSNELKIINNQKVLGKDFNIYGTIEEPLFKAKDVADWIEHSNASKMVLNVDEDEKKIVELSTLTNSYSATMLTEYGLYEVLMQSRKPIAKEFKKEVKVILKQLRQTGVVIMDNATEKSIDFEKKYGIYRIRKTFTNSNDLRADYDEFNKLAKENRLSGQDRIKRLNIIFDSIQKKLNTNLTTLKGSEMLFIQELLTDISQDTKKLSNKVNGGIKTGQTKMIKKQQDFIEWIYPDNNEYNIVNYHGFSINCMNDYKNKYREWKTSFPVKDVDIKDIDFNKPVYIWLKFDHKNKIDVQNLSKTFIDRLCAIYGVDDKYIQIMGCVTNKYVDHYTDGKCYYILKQGEWEVGE